MKKILIILTTFIPLLSFSQNDNDKIIYERAKTLQFVHYETDLMQMMLSGDTIEANIANKIFDQFQKLAINEYDKIIQEFPKSELLLDALYNKAEAQYNLGLNKEAKATFEKVILNNPQKGKSLIYLAFIALEEKKYSDALKYIEQRKKLTPKFFCGNEYQTEENQMKYIEEKCKIGLSKN
ncbi:hypothetical protein FCR2A7T_29740 [Flavobacterium cauense R2A-7]|uniref:Tetratricopeptide repeat protein n=1 Tax=Flavobacterium cauense R2A-7 TaxID=1341154 RepID=V6RV90_9FLAO|nr:tetratricopeptide repeat protein [Flavobacterium cauense]ESU18448.1 hypothetical protein FCR2A7T_29740 [Flavobacterium cauense R2A-7]KGO79445.1 hypothetical protein Q762_14175 [Flavobacterium cauense R2A-7]TWI08106.1 tetratricopeptide repeat protein [Flavobacterium cauense R2A-7]